MQVSGWNLKQANEVLLSVDRVFKKTLFKCALNSW